MCSLRPVCLWPSVWVCAHLPALRDPLKHESTQQPLGRGTQQLPISKFCYWQHWGRSSPTSLSTRHGFSCQGIACFSWNILVTEGDTRPLSLKMLAPLPSLWWTILRIPGALFHGCPEWKYTYIFDYTNPGHRTDTFL